MHNYSSVYFYPCASHLTNIKWGIPNLKRGLVQSLVYWRLICFFILVIFDRLTLNGQCRSVQPKKKLYVHLEGNIFQIQSQGFSVEGQIKHILHGYNPIVSTPCWTFIHSLVCLLCSNRTLKLSMLLSLNNVLNHDFLLLLGISYFPARI